MSGIETAPWPERNSAGWELIASTSAWRVTTEYPGPTGMYGTSGSVKKAKGRSRRSASKSACRSAGGRPQKSRVGQVHEIHVDRDGGAQAHRVPPAGTVSGDRSTLGGR